MRLERKLLLLFLMLVLVAGFFGWRDPSFEEVRARAADEWHRLEPVQIERIESIQARFSRQATPACLETTGITPDNFTLVAEIGPDGRVIRSWRQGESRFIACFQRLVNEHFEFRGMDRSFYMAYEYVREH